MSPSHSFAKKTKTLMIAATLALFVAGLMSFAAADASAGAGGLSTDTKAGKAEPAHKKGSSRSAKGERRYKRIWKKKISRKNKRWAKRTAACESGGNPKAIGGGGKYRGAFQFLKTTWRNVPRSPGGDPITYSYKTQAVVAVTLKTRSGPHHWPTCG